MLPSDCCTDAIASTVCAIWAPVRMPATSGSFDSAKTALPPFCARPWHFFSVHDQALAEHRVERTFGDSRPPRVVLDEVAEEVVVSLDGRDFGIVEAVRALQPPVRRVERVRVVRTPEEAAGELELLLELVLTVDANVRTGRVVIAVVDR